MSPKQSINEPSLSKVVIEAGKNNGTFPLCVAQV